DGVVSALKQPFFSKNSKKDKHQNDVCLQSEAPLEPFTHQIKSTTSDFDFRRVLANYPLTVNTRATF
ncbi:hypothetical protein Q7W06_10195, partial [Streptococcus suis]|nr:hypothetical protein [Streptococcus suis]